MAWGRGLTAFLIVAILAMATSVIFGEGGIPHLRRLRAERQQLGESVIALTNRNQALRDDISHLNTDDFYLEALARRELGYVRPNEMVYRFRRDR